MAEWPAGQTPAGTTLERSGAAGPRDLASVLAAIAPTAMVSRAAMAQLLVVRIWSPRNKKARVGAG